MSDPVEELQGHVYSRIMADTWFEDAFVLQNEKGVLLKDIESRLKVFKSPTGKKGLAILVDRPLRDVKAPDLPGPEWNIQIPVTVFEWATLNRASSGTGKTIEEVISRLAGLLGTFAVQHLGTMVYLDKDTVTPGITDDGLIFAEIQLAAQLNQEPPQKVATPLVRGTAAAVTIDTSIGFGLTDGAEILYTIDGSYPRPGSAAATSYGFVLLTETGHVITTESGNPLLVANPFSVDAGTTVLAVAYATGKQASDLAGRKFNS